MIVGIKCKLTKDGAKDVDLLVFSEHMNGNSPFRSVTNWNWASVRNLGGAYLDTPASSALDKAFADVLTGYSGYKVKDRQTIEIP